MKRTLGHAGLWIALHAGCGASAAEPTSAVLVADPPPDSGGVPGGPSSPDFQRGIAYLEKGAYEQAREHFVKVVRERPDSSEASFYVGVVSEKLKDPAMAERSYLTALGTDPHFKEAAENLSALYLESEPPRADDAIRVLRGLGAALDDSARVLHNLALAYVAKKELPQAADAYERALTKGGADSVELLFGYATLLIDMGKKERAAEILRRAVKLEAADETAMLASLGRLFGYAGDYDGCVQAMARVIEKTPKDPEPLVRRGVCLHELKREKEAAADFTRALQADKKYVPASYYLGLSLVAQGKPRSGALHLERAWMADKTSELGKKAKAKLDETMKAIAKQK